MAVNMRFLGLLRKWEATEGGIVLELGPAGRKYVLRAEGADGASVQLLDHILDLCSSEDGTAEGGGPSMSFPISPIENDNFLNQSDPEEFLGCP